MIMETDTFFISYKKYNSIEINLYIKYNLVTFSIYILNVEKGIVKICNLLSAHRHRRMPQLYSLLKLR